MNKRARFVFLGGLVLAVVLFAPDLIRRTLDPVPTRHQPALLLSYERHQVDPLIEQIEALEGVRRVDLQVINMGLTDMPVVFGELTYDGFSLMWRPESQFPDFDTQLRPWKGRFSGEPDPAEIDAAMQRLEALVSDLEGGSALFITDAELRGS